MTAKSDFASFVEYVFRDEKDRPLRIQPFQWPLLEAIVGKEGGNTLLVLPPGGGKTTLAAIAYPAWAIGRDPSETILLICNTDMQAQARSMAVQEVITGSPEYSHIFAVEADKDRRWSASEWYVKRPVSDYPHATMFASGMMAGKVLGFRASTIVIDDPADQYEARSDLVRERHRSWLKQTVFTRLLPNGRIIAIMTRWHQDDCAAMFIDEGFRVVHVPALGADDHSYWPTRFPADMLRRERGRDPGEFACVYQGDPSQLGGTKIERGWLRFFDDPLVKAAGLTRTAAYADLAISKSTQAHRTAVGYGGLDAEGNFYVLDVACGKWSWPEAKQVIKNVVRTNKVRMLGFQKTMFEQMAVDELRTDPDMSGVAFRQTSGKDDKLLRFEPVVDRAYARKLHIAEANWTAGYVDELVSFPLGRYDDQCDMTSGLVEILADAVPAAGEVGVRRRSGMWDRKGMAVWDR